jgi:6-phosphogluconolactonase
MTAQFSAVSTTKAASTGSQWVYFGTYTGQKSKGIYVARFEPATGKLSAPELAAETRNPTFLAVNPTRQVLYAVNEVNDFGDPGSGAVSAFRLDQKTGQLTFLNQQPSGGSGPCHLAVAHDNSCVLVASYGSGSVAVLPLEENGLLKKPSASIQHHGSSINRQRQEGPHAHFITWAPGNRLILTCDLGLDKVLIYHLDAPRFGLSANNPPDFPIKPGSGPRHLAFHPSGRYLYLLNEISSTLTVCSYDENNGELKEIQTVSTLPDNFHGASTCAEVQVDPAGQFVYASNRGHDSIAVFAVDQANGKVKLVQDESTQGKTPRHFSLAPGGHWLLAENQDSDNVVVFGVDSHTGRLNAAGISQNIVAPVCAIFVPQL